MTHGTTYLLMKRRAGVHHKNIDSWGGEREGGGGEGAMVVVVIAHRSFQFPQSGLDTLLLGIKMF